MFTMKLLNEDWTAVVVAFAIILVALGGFSANLPAISWQSSHELFAAFKENAVVLIVLWAFGFLVFVVASLLKGDKVTPKALLGYTLIFLIAIGAQAITGHRTVKELGLEIVLFSLIVGLFISNVIGTPRWVKPVVQTELYIKIGLVLLGTGIIFREVLQAGALGMMQSLAVVLVVWQFCFWIGKRLRIDEELRTMLASAVAICGVSAAIATAGAIKGDNKKLSYVISLVLITAIPMMLIMPYIAKAAGMPEAVAGAWLGGTIDTTGAVVAAGTLLGPEALKFATVVKFSQNVLLGLAAFVISVYWAYRKSSESERPSARTIWDRFPKFVLGFMVASFLFSFLLPESAQAVKGSLKGIQTFWFAMAFTCIGLETRFSDIFSAGSGRPALVFLVAQLFNVLFTLGVAWVVFS